MITHALVRKPGPNFGDGLTTFKSETPDYEKMLLQHRLYVGALRSIGLEVIDLEADPAYPDGYFVEDTAVVTPETAVITHPGAESRRGEETSVAPVLVEHRKLARIEPPGTLEGGDVLMAGRLCFIGLSERTNALGASQLGAALTQYGYGWVTVELQDGLHLKSSVNVLDEQTLIMTQDFAGHSCFERYDRIVVDEDEAYAANTLRINDVLIVPEGYPKTLNQLEKLNRQVLCLDVSEARKMDGGLTCMSIRF